MKDEKTIDDDSEDSIRGAAAVHDKIQYNEAEGQMKDRKNQVTALLRHVLQHEKELPFFPADCVHLVENQKRNVHYKQIVLKHGPAPYNNCK